MNDYSDKTIVSMKFLEHVRAKSGMYSFQLNSIQGLQQQLKEVVDNSVDEALDPDRIYDINLTFFIAKDKSTYQCLIQDFGRGIPVNKLADCFTKEFTSGKYRGEYGGKSSGTFGVGSKASAALSKVFIAFTKRDDGFGYLRVEKGVIKDYKTQRARVDKNAATIGTTVLLQPDDTMFQKIDEMFKNNVTGEEYTGIEHYISRLEFYSLFKRNVRLTVRFVDGLLKNSDLAKDPVELWKWLTDVNNFKSTIAYQTNPDETPRSYVIRKFGLKQPTWELGVLTKPGSDIDPLSYDIDLFLDERSVKGDNGFIGAVNATPIVHPESSHIVMLQTVIKDYLSDNIADAEAKVFFENKYRVPFSGCISVGWQGAEFIGQDKTRFENRQFCDAYRSSLRKALRKITEERGDGFWDGLWELIKDNFEQEYAKFMHKSFRTNASIKNLCFSLRRPDSFDNCKLTNNQVTELFITEGDSAAGGVIKARDGKTQALLSLSGKPINAIRAEGKKLNANAIYQDLITILGVNPSDKTLDNMRFSKILIMTDADADGYHIVALLIGLFYKINPLILEEGRVYVTNPPLYALANKQGTVFLRDEAALRDTRINSYRILLDIDMSLDGGKTSIHLNQNRNQFRDICMIVTYVTDVLKHQADLLNIDYMVLEQLLHVVDYLDDKNVNVKAIEKKLHLDSAVWDKVNNVLVLIDHGMEWRIPLNNLQASLRAYVLPLYKKFHWDKYELFVSTKYTDLYRSQPCTFAMLASIFHDIDKIYKVSRFKGLGEMSKEALKLTCIDKMTRCFTVIKGIGDVDRLYKMLDVDTEARKKLVIDNLLEE